ncbi:stress-response A/B barrel domain-containing protein UP3 [Beta vulgaris subsp. vulgaris]|uniref:stress-response A/B barrel domain-containing protein UP3 n=1 Tax=Beta vulgaris subsp. vulgaris TaxID=3555 RepID=UPI0020367EAF|nr:stress-response A/B barrel domain-containing protein UP3 [Beta vulgaris subsp. vulgaris]
MESPSSETEIIEHVVLFNIKDEDFQDPSKVNAMVNGLNALNSLNSVTYLTAGPILRTRSLPSSLKFTHMLHARYSTRANLSEYSLCDEHVSVVESLVKPICDDVMAVDWAVDLLGQSPSVPRPGSGMRFTFLKIEDVEEREKILEGMKKKEESLGGFEQISFGENISDRGKGFSVAFLVVFHDLNELDACEEYEDQMRKLIDKFKVSDDHLIAVDYVVPRLSPATSLD